MTSEDKTKKAAANDEAPEQSETVNAGGSPTEAKPVDPKEVAYRRSKEDLARKRRNLRGSRGKF